ncbi:hypothetical protein DBP12_36990 [Streptomyces sp. CS014]|nr:hypothetical protein DBP12_36990 [Streptomyces sp. CS014]
MDFLAAGPVGTGDGDDASISLLRSVDQRVRDTARRAREARIDGCHVETYLRRAWSRQSPR